MDELEELCSRLAGDQAAAARLMQQVGRAGERTERIARVLAAAREADETHGAATGSAGAAGGAAEPPPGERGLAEAVADELARATARLPPRQREVLALREYLGLTHAEIAPATGADQAAVVGLLAAARLRLRDELRGGRPSHDGSGAVVEGCPERDRALRTITLRQDAEQVTAADEDWLLEHLGHCVTCAQAHAAMLEASARYRAWPSRVRPATARPELSSRSTAG